MLFRSTSRSLHGPLRAAAARLAVPRSLHVALVLDGGVHLVLSPATYMLGGRGGESTLNVSEPFVDELLRADGVLLGCIAMRGVYVHHDVAAGRLGFAELGREFQ